MCGEPVHGDAMFYCGHPSCFTCLKELEYGPSKFRCPKCTERDAAKWLFYNNMTEEQKVEIDFGEMAYKSAKYKSPTFSVADSKSDDGLLKKMLKTQGHYENLSKANKITIKLIEQGSIEGIIPKREKPDDSVFGMYSGPFNKKVGDFCNSLPIPTTTAEDLKKSSSKGGRLPQSSSPTKRDKMKQEKREEEEDEELHLLL